MGQERRSWLERFNAAYPLLIAGIIASSNVSMTLMQTFIQSFGTLVILVALVIVEQHGIKDGIHLFLQDMNIAIFAAWAVVLANVIVDIIIVNIEHEARYKAPRGAVWSARLALRNLAYRVGYEDKKHPWKARPQSPAQILIQWKRFLTLVLFALALFGRMHVAIKEASTTDAGGKVDMGTGISDLLYRSSLQDFVVWTGGTLFTMLTVLSVQRMTHQIATRVIVIQDELKQRERNLKAAATRQRLREEKEARALARIATDESRLSVPVSTQTDTRQTGSGYVRVSSAVDKARQWLTDNPDKADMPVRELADRIGVGKDSVAKARKEMKG